MDVDYGIYAVLTDPAKWEWGTILVGTSYHAASPDESSLTLPRAGYCDRNGGWDYYTLHFNYNGVAAVFTAANGGQLTCQTLFDNYLRNSCKYLTAKSVSSVEENSWDHIGLGGSLECKYAVAYDELMKKQQEQIAICKRIAAERPESIHTNGRVWPFF